ncbi:MAG: GNAT family N-acetyltransferase [Saprospiraceae bacterium]
MKIITLSSDKSKLDIPLIHHVLTKSYWAKGRTLSEVKKSIENSFCYGIYSDDEQIGFARVVSDTVIFGYIADVFIIKNERGKNHASVLMNFILSDEKLEKVTQWYLKTKDAHQFYDKHGFGSLKNQGWFLERIKTK